jgi:Circularly permutated YpsA SLOG family
VRVFMRRTPEARRRSLPQVTQTLCPCPDELYFRARSQTLWFGSTVSPGAKLTLRAVHSHDKPMLFVMAGMPASRIAGFLRRNPGIRVVNTAGNRESRSSGIAARTERFLADVLRQLRENDEPTPPDLP